MTKAALGLFPRFREPKLLPPPPKPLSAVAGILDSNGGLRVVVTQRWRMRHHVGKKERLFVLPDFQVQEPVPWDDIPPLILRVQKHVATSLAPVNHCGGCNACCITPYIDDPALKKPSHSVCPNCAVGFGCKLYQSRPKACQDFKCWWLKSQERNDRMAPALRPDRCGAYFTEDSRNGDPLLIECHGEPNAAAWQWINEMQATGYRIKKISFYDGETNAASVVS